MRSYVVKRLLQRSHSRRRRMESGFFTLARIDYAVLRKTAVRTPHRTNFTETGNRPSDTILQSSGPLNNPPTAHYIVSVIEHCRLTGRYRALTLIEDGRDLILAADPQCRPGRLMPMANFHLHPDLTWMPASEIQFSRLARISRDISSSSAPTTTRWESGWIAKTYFGSGELRRNPFLCPTVNPWIPRDAPAPPQSGRYQFASRFRHCSALSSRYARRNTE